MAKTLVEKLASPTDDVSIFKISGVLGYHENAVIERFFSECGKKNILRLILDFSELGSLGGGCARIIRQAAASGGVTICIVGASATVRSFLENKGETPIVYLDSQGEALEKIKAAPAPQPASEPVAAAVAAEVEEQKTQSPKDGLSLDAAPPVGEPLSAAEKSAPSADESLSAAGAPAQDDAPSADADPPKKEKSAPAKSKPTPSDRKKAPAKDKTSSQDASKQAEDGPQPPNRELERTIVQYRALFSVNADFNRIHEKSRLLDAFLLTAIAQVGVESAVFLEFRMNTFVAITWKGLETADPDSLAIPRDEVDLELWLNNPVIMPIEEAPLSEKVKERIGKWDMPYIAPFIVYDEFRGLVLLGSPIRNKLDDDASHYLGMLIKQAAIAYENSCRYEEESQRTLGLVHSLISMIEENTASRGNTEMMINYTYATAKAMHYPEEHIQNLLYGTVLRDIGMIKVSDLIVRTPRELQDDEWDVIKGHPIEGAEMLRKMKFAEHTSKIVLYHHERFNGEGYPKGLQGPQIPLGARIVSVVESYAAMLQDRPTRPALGEEEALGTLRENWGIRYDPDVVKAFVEIVEEEIRTGEKVKYPGSDLFKV